MNKYSIVSVIKEMKQIFFVSPIKLAEFLYWLVYICIYIHTSIYVDIEVELGM